MHIYNYTLCIYFTFAKYFQIFIYINTAQMVCFYMLVIGDYVDLPL
jgi:hypothetical protein